MEYVCIHTTRIDISYYSGVLYATTQLKEVSHNVRHVGHTWDVASYSEKGVTPYLYL